MAEAKLSEKQTATFFSGTGRTRRALLESLGAGAIAISLSSCSESQSNPNSSQSQSNGNSEDKKLQILNWESYIGENTLTDYKAKTGVDVSLSVFGDNEELLSKMLTDKSKYDIIFPSADFIQRMSRKNLLLPLDHSKITNIANIAPEYMNLTFDPQNKYSMPYTWSVQGIAYRKSAMKNGIVPDSWKYLLDSDEYSQRISLIGSSADLYRMVFKYFGKSANDYSPELLKQAEELLKKQLQHIHSFHEDNGQDLLLEKKVDLTWEYNGDIAQAMVADSDLAFCIPKEGSILDADNICISAGTKSPNNAHAFVNFMLDAQNGADILKTIQYPTPNSAAKALMDESYRLNQTIFPKEIDLAKCEYCLSDNETEMQAYIDAMARLRPNEMPLK